MIHRSTENIIPTKQNKPSQTLTQKYVFSRRFLNVKAPTTKGPSETPRFTNEELIPKAVP